MSEQAPTLIAGKEPSVLSLQTDHMGQNGTNVSVDVCKTLDVASQTPVVCMQGGDVSNTITARSNSSPTDTQGYPVVCVADDNANAATDVDMCGSLKVGGGSAVNSNGDDLCGTLAARDFKGVGNQYVEEGKVICQRTL